MKKLLISSLALLSLTACTSKTVYVTQTTEDTYTPATDAPEPTFSKEDVFVTAINDEYPYVMSDLGGRYELIQFGKLVCQAIDEGSTATDFALMAVNNDVDPTMLGFIMGAAIATFCPENQWFIDQFGA